MAIHPLVCRLTKLLNGNKRNELSSIRNIEKTGEQRKNPLLRLFLCCLGVLTFRPISRVSGVRLMGAKSLGPCNSVGSMAKLLIK